LGWYYFSNSFIGNFVLCAGPSHGGPLMLVPACRQRQVRANISKYSSNHNTYRLIKRACCAVKQHGYAQLTAALRNALFFENLNYCKFVKP
jgi:hypothetical protein